MSARFDNAETRRAEFESVAIPHLPDLYRAALAMFKNPAEAEDVTQEVFVEAWRSFSRFEPGTNCRAWLFKILMHKASHHRRKWFRRLKQAPLDDVLENTIEAVPSIPDGLTDEEILAALGRLPEAFRDILILADVQEFAYKEIADIQQIPIGTVMSRLSRARAALRRELGGPPG
ncbi:MAG: sigma-70 family RNA polymerase sigma factor [Bryobacterales bacterium]|nr:sigma-70 family RNA polymerase sigma factor [Bryobacterales bacterium]